MVVVWSATLRGLGVLFGFVIMFVYGDIRKWIYIRNIDRKNSSS